MCRSWDHSFSADYCEKRTTGMFFIFVKGLPMKDSMEWTNGLSGLLQQQPGVLLGLGVVACLVMMVLIYQKFRDALQLRRSKQQLLEELVQFVEIEEFFRDRGESTTLKPPVHEAA